MNVVYKAPGAGRRRRTAGIAMLAIAVAVIGAAGLAPQRALAHGGGDEAGAVDLVEQALAIVVNSPDAIGEALERIEAALVEEAEEPSGDLDVASLEAAVAALEAGDLHDAEDALVAALGVDPHADGVDAGQASPPSTDAEAPVQASPDAPVTADGNDTPGTGDPTDEAQPVETAAVSDDAIVHGLTERVEGGFRAPSGTGVAALVLAAALGAGGLALAYSKTGGK